MPQFGQGTISTGGGENGEACGACIAGTAVAGTDVDSEGAALEASGDGLGRTGTCMGTEPSPICTDGPEAGAVVPRGPEPGAAGLGAKTGAATGGGVGPIGWAWPGKEPKAPAEAATVGPTGEKIPGSGGTAVLATPMAGANSGGGVGGSISAGGAGFGAGAAACNLAPQPRQNL